MLAVALDDPGSRLVAWLYLVLVPLAVASTVLAFKYGGGRGGDDKEDAESRTGSRIGSFVMLAAAKSSIFSSKRQAAPAAVLERQHRQRHRKRHQYQIQVRHQPAAGVVQRHRQHAVGWVRGRTGQ